MSNTVKDYYEILRVKPTATTEEINKRFRIIVRKYHPDTNAGDTGKEEEFKEAVEAKTVLLDPEKRKKYDELRQGGERPVLKPPEAYVRPKVKTEGEMVRERHQALLAREIEIPEDERYLIAGLTKFWENGKSDVQTIEVNDKEGKPVWKLSRGAGGKIAISRRLSDFVPEGTEIRTSVKTSFGPKEVRIDEETFFTTGQIRQLSEQFGWIPRNYPEHLGEMAVLALQAATGFRGIEGFLNQGYQTAYFVEENRSLLKDTAKVQIGKILEGIDPTRFIERKYGGGEGGGRLV